MPERVNGGVFTDEVVTGSLRHFVITGADFSGAQDAHGRPVTNSAADIVFRNITKRATVVIMNPVSQTNRGMSFALESNRADWTEDELQLMVTGLGNNVGVDNLDLTSVLVHEVPYDFTIGASMKFTDLIDTPDSYPPNSKYASVTVNITENGLEFAGSFAQVPLNSTSSPVEVGTRYFITENMTVTLPNIFSGLTVGDYIIFTKDVAVTAIIQTDTATQFIDTDLGSDTSINFDISEELIFIYDGDGWSLQIGAKA